MNARDRDELAASARAVAFTARWLERSLGEMTLPQLRVLSLVASSPERANRIAERAAVSRPSLTGILDGLEARGWVRRVDVVGDRRGVLLEVTGAGTEALRQAEHAMTGALDGVLDAADPAGRRTIIAGLTALGQVLRTHRERREAAASAAAPPEAAKAKGGAR
jgi:DNA-binding MarR family transcriptional regulator